MNKKRINRTAPKPLDYMLTLMQLKRRAGKNSTADLYRATRNHLIQFWGSEAPQSFSDITPGMVDNFKLWLEGNKLEPNSVVTYLSNFRACYNAALRNRLFPLPEVNPFVHIRLKPQPTAKRAIPVDVIQEIANLDLEQKPELKKTAHLCLFSFMACGIPFVDLVHLRKENLINGTLSYQRVKTHARINISITPGMRYIMDYYQQPDSPFLFPMFEGNEISHDDYKALLKEYNTNLKKIAKLLSIAVILTSYVMRHSWATTAWKKNIPISIISQALGHTSEATTRYYLASLEQKELDRANIIITNDLDCIIRKVKPTLFRK